MRNGVKILYTGQATDDNIIRCMRFGCWIIEATDTHSEYVILIETDKEVVAGNCILRTSKMSTLHQTSVRQSDDLCHIFSTHGKDQTLSTG